MQGDDEGSYEDMCRAAQRDGRDDVQAPADPREGSDLIPIEGPGLAVTVMCLIQAVSELRGHAKELAEHANEMACALTKLTKENERMSAEVARLTGDARAGGARPQGGRCRGC